MDTTDDSYYVARAMVAHGGSFVHFLGEALIRADGENRVRIMQAFPEYWERYLQIGLKEYRA